MAQKKAHLSHKILISSLLCFSAYATAPDNTLVYVTDQGGKTVYVIDPIINTATATVSVASGLPPFVEPRGISLSTDQTFAYVADSGQTYRIDTATNQAVATVQGLDSSSVFENVVISPSQSFAYMTQGDGPNMYYMDTATNTATKKVFNNTTEAFQSLHAIAIAPNEQFAYVVDNSSNQIYYIDVASNTATQLVKANATIGQPIGIAISPDNSFAYVCDNTSAAIFKIDTTTNNAVKTDTNGFTPYGPRAGMAISPDGTFALVACTGNNGQVFYIDTATNTITKEITCPSAGEAYYPNIAISSDGSYAYVGGGVSQEVTKIDIANRIASSITNLSGNNSGTNFAYPAGVGMRLYPFKINTTAIDGNNLQLAEYFNEDVPYTTRYPVIRLQGSYLPEGLEAVAPTRNTFSTFSAQTGQVSFARVVSSHVANTRWERMPQRSSSVSSTAWDEEEYEDDSLLTYNDDSFIALKQEGSDEPMESSPDGMPQVWLTGFGEYSHVLPGGQSPTFSAGSGGVVLGADYSGLYPHPLGAGLAYAHTHIHEKNDAGYANINQGAVFTYGLFQMGRWYFDAALWGGYYHTHNVRQISFQYYPGGHATSNIHGWQLSPHLEVGYDVWKGSIGLEPFIVTDYVATWESRAKEKGSTLYNFEQKSRYCSLLRSESGLRIKQVVKCNVGTLTFTEKASYAYQKAFNTGTINAFLVGSPGSVTVSTLKGAQNLGVAELSMHFIPKGKSLSSILTFHTELGSSYQTYEGILELNRKF